MNLKNLVSVIKSGNNALGQKLNNLLTDDCNILEYTDDAVLFTKNNYLVLANFNHPLTEAKLTSSDVTDNTIIRISSNSTKRELVKTLHNTISSLVEENFVGAEKSLQEFCESYYHFFVLKNRYPDVFTESLNKKSRGFGLRKKAFDSLSQFKSEVFSLVAINESTEVDIADYTSLIEAYGHILFLGKKKLQPVMVDALLGNESLAEQFLTTLFAVATELTEANEELKDAMDSGFDIESGKFDDEDEDDVNNENLEDDNFTGEEDFPEDDEFAEDSSKEATDFDVSKLSDVEVKELHRSVLRGILTGMKDFVSRESNDPDKTDIPADLDEKLTADLDELEKVSMDDDVLSSIEARWQPILSYFLDSDMYQPDQELVGNDVSIEDVVPGGEEEEELPPEENMPPQENLPPGGGQPQNSMPPAPLGPPPQVPQQ